MVGCCSDDKPNLTTVILQYNDEYMYWLASMYQESFFFQNYSKYISYKLPRSKIIDCIVDQRDWSLIAHIHLFLLCVLQYYNFGPVSWQNALVYGSNCDCGHNLAQLARFSLIIHYSGGTCSIAVLWGLLTKPYNAVQILCVGTTQVIIRDGKQHGI